MPANPEKIDENRVRRMAKRQGYAAHKSRRRDPNAPDYSAIWLAQSYVLTPRGMEPIENPEGSEVEWLGPFDGFDDLEQWLNADPATRSGR